jgi:hypothetical protein
MNPGHCLILCFKTGNPTNCQLALDYWEGSERDAKWKWHFSVDELASAYGIRKSEVTRTVKDAAEAASVQRRCVRCDAPQVLFARSDYMKRFFGEYVCGSCLLEQHFARVQRQEDEARQRFARERDHIAKLSARNEFFRYDQISYADAVIAFGIMLASDEACEAGTFRDSDGLHLCAGSDLSSKLLGRIFNAGILRMSADTVPQAIVLEDDSKWSYYPHRVNWQFAADSAGRTFPQVMSFLSELLDSGEEHPEYGKAIAELWWALGYDDALWHLCQEVDSYRLPDVRVGPKTEDAIRYALRHFSIPQVRREITSVVKNAAALSQHRDFAKHHALSTIH